MNARISCALWLAVVGLLRVDLAWADPAEAEDTAYRMARKYTEKSFAMAPTDHSGVCGGGTAIEFLIPVNKGLDYVFLVGTDLAARDVDIYVYDDVGGLILDDRRPGRLAGVQFRSSYNGTTKVYMHMASSIGLASWYVLVGRRGSIKPETTLPNTNVTGGRAGSAGDQSEGSPAAPETLSP
jgi:hypothetical protein